MLKSDRDSIEVNIAGLVRATDYKRLMECCLERRILFDVMREKIERIHDTESKRHRALFLKLMTRGPDAFGALLQLCNTEFPDAVRILRNEVSLNNRAAPKPTSPPKPTAIQPSKPPQTTANPLHHLTAGTSPVPHAAHQMRHLQLAEYTDPLPAATAFRQVRNSVRFHGNQPNEIACYPMQSRNRGVAFLVNIIRFQNRPKEPRHGAEVDKVNLVQLFRQMGFTVLYYENVTGLEMRRLLAELRNSRWLRNTDCFVMALMTHGTMVNEVAKVEFSDNSFLDLNEVLSNFSNRNSEALLHKPKVFLFPFCRGHTLEQPLGLQRRAGSGGGVGGGGGRRGRSRFGTDVAADMPTLSLSDSDDDDDDEGGGGASRLAAGGALANLIPTYSDIKICYATGPGFEAMRDPDTGSWYIESMCGIWATHAHDKSLDDLLKMVGEYQLNKQSEEGNIQTAHNEDRGFFRKLYFNPGYYGDMVAVDGPVAAVATVVPAAVAPTEKRLDAVPLVGVDVSR